MLVYSIADAARRAMEAGFNRQIQRLSLPAEFATALVEWPGGKQTGLCMHMHSRIVLYSI
jgi:hypothetical protein